MSIKPKAKPCKGEGKAHGYGCGKITMFRKYGLGTMCCFNDWLYKSEAGKVERTKSLNSTRPNKTELKKALTATKKEVHEYIRLRDKGKPCISCNRPWSKTFQAGHYFKAELYETLRFNLDNIHGQCPECNLMHEGNLLAYAVSLPKRIGQQAFDELMTLSKIDKFHSKVWNIDNLQEIVNQIKTLKSKLNGHIKN